MGTTEETIETEQVEIIDGQGRTKYPIYGIDTVEYKQTNLGGITHSENGNIVTATEGESLVELTYTTKYKLWHGIDQLSEDVQFVLEGENG